MKLHGRLRSVIGLLRLPGLLLAAACAGCVAVPLPSRTDTYAESLKPFAIGTTTRDEVRAVLGSPVELIGDGTELYAWDSDKYLYLVGFGWGGVGAGDAGIAKTGHLALVRFDQGGRLAMLDHIYSGDDELVESGAVRLREIVNVGFRRHPCGKQFTWSRPCSGDFAFSPEGRLLAAGRDHEGDAVALLDVGTLGMIAALKPVDPDCNALNALAFSPDGHLLAAGFRGFGVLVWNVASRARVLSITAHTGDCGWLERGGVNAVAFSPDGRQLATGAAWGGDGTIRIWDIESGAQLRSFASGQSGSIHSLDFGPQGNYLASADDDAIRIWRLTGEPGGALVHRIASRRDEDSQNPALVRFVPGAGKLAVLRCVDGLLALWDLKPSDEGAPEIELDAAFFTSFTLPRGASCALDVSSDGTRLYTNSAGVLDVYDTVRNERVERFLLTKTRAARAPLFASAFLGGGVAISGVTRWIANFDMYGDRQVLMTWRLPSDTEAVHGD